MADRCYAVAAGALYPAPAPSGLPTRFPAVVHRLAQNGFADYIHGTTF